jgi:outer membrane protein TolC
MMKNRWSILGLLCLLAGFFVGVGCSSKQYRRAADKEAYGMIQQTEKKVFGHTNSFTIDTPYSGRKPSDILPSELIDNRMQTNRRVLSIDGALTLAVKNSREYQTAKENLFNAALSLSDARYQYKPIFDAGATIGDKNDDKYTSANGKVSITQLLRTGGRLSASLSSSMLRYYSGDPRRSVVNVVAVDLVQPLLRGFGRDNPAIENLKLAERNVVYAVRSFGYYQHQFALGIVNDYFRLLQQKDTIRNSYTNYLRRVESTKRLEARSKDREPTTQVDQSRQAELSAKNSYVDNVARYRNELDRFKITLGIPLGEDVFLDDKELDALEQTGLLPTPLNPDAAYRFAAAKKLTILNEIDQFEDVQRRVRITANQLKTELNLFANAQYDWNQPRDYSNFNADKIKWEAGLDLNLPFDRLRQRNTYRAALMAFEAEIRSLTLTLDKLKDSIDRGVRTLEQRRQNYLIQKNALALANRRVESTTMLLKAGRIEVRDLNDALDSQIAAQNSVTVALVSYQESRLQLLLDIGALNSESQNFWLKDHLAAVNAGKPSTGVQASVSEEAVTPPETLFDTAP